MHIVTDGEQHLDSDLIKNFKAGDKILLTGYEEAPVLIENDEQNTYINVGNSQVNIMNVELASLTISDMGDFYSVEYL